MSDNPQSQFLKGCARVLVLRILSDRPMYGYEIAGELRARSQEFLQLGQGTLYPMLYSLERAGLIQVDHEAQAPAAGRRRLYYRITAKGRTALGRDLSIWGRIERGMRLVLKDAHGTG